MDIQSEIIRILKTAFAEDIGAGDVTGNSVISADAVGAFIFRAREDMVFCGEAIFKTAFGGEFRNSELKIEVHAKDGEHLAPGGVIAKVSGNVREILAKERTVLNLIQHLSAVATETAKYVEAVAGTKAKILDTRKTTPGLRVLEKFAVKCGGGQNHRMGLYDMVMVKDNHIRAAGGIAAAVAAARSTGLKIEVECDRLEQVEEAIAAGADVILADNMNAALLKQVVALSAGRIPIEASGNVNLATVREIAETGVDYISTSKITIGAKPVDIGLDEI